MPRQLRIEFAGAFYHVLARGDRREPIVLDDEDRSAFVKTMGRVCARTHWRIHGWVLMDNHYHWLLETPEANLVEGMRWFQNTYTRRFNVRHQLWGHLFGGRYKAVVVDPHDRSGNYFGTLLDYIHLNPARAGMVEADDGLGLLRYRWSSLVRAYAVPRSQRPDWICVDRGLRHFGCRDVASDRRRFLGRLENRVRAEKKSAGWIELDGQGLQSTLRRGWYWGSQAMKEKLRNHLEQSPSPPTLSRDLRLTPGGRALEEAKAEEICQSALRKRGLSESELPSLSGSDVRKVEIAALVQEHSSVSQAWIAERLQMKSPGNVSLLLHKWRKTHGD